MCKQRGPGRHQELLSLILIDIFQLSFQRTFQCAPLVLRLPHFNPMSFVFLCISCLRIQELREHHLTHNTKDHSHQNTRLGHTFKFMARPIV